VESGLARLQKFELEVDWVTKTLDAFDAVWENMTIENRLIHLGSEGYPGCRRVHSPEFYQ
jgi:hypothetical protein